MAAPVHIPISSTQGFLLLRPLQHLLSSKIEECITKLNLVMLVAFLLAIAKRLARKKEDGKEDGIALARCSKGSSHPSGEGMAPEAEGYLLTQHPQSGSRVPSQSGASL